MKKTPDLYVRATLFYIFSFVASIVIFTGSLPALFFSYRVRYRCICSWTHVTLFLGKILCGVHYRVTGLENIPSTPCVVMCKHQSAWETIFLPTILPIQCWVLKESLLKLPFFGWGLSLLKPIVIPRKHGRNSYKYLIDQGIDRLKKGIWIMIYPEGTRVRVTETKTYSRSGVLLARAAQVPILPISHNAGHFWPPDSFLKYPGTVDIVIGKPVVPNENAEEDIKKIAAWIEENSYKKLKTTL